MVIFVPMFNVFNSDFTCLDPFLSSVSSQVHKKALLLTVGLKSPLCVDFKESATACSTGLTGYVFLQGSVGNYQTFHLA